MRIRFFLCIHRFYTFLSVFSTVIDKKKIGIKSFLPLVLLSVFLSGHSYAEVWYDSFDDEELIGWERISLGNQSGSKWESVGGILFANTEDCFEPPFCNEITVGFLHWKIVEFNFEQLTMIGEEITYLQGEEGQGELCLFLGKRQDEPELAAEGYIVSPEEISKVAFSKKDGFSRGKTKAWYGNIFKDTTRNLTTVFDSGHFQVWTNRHLITEFLDENLKTIDIVGLLITTHFGSHWFGSRISSISITDRAIIIPNLVVQLRDTQLTTTWGELRQIE